MAHFVIAEPADSGTAAVRNLLTAVQRGQLKQAVTRNLLPLFRGLGDVVRLLWYRDIRKRRAVSARAEVFLNIDLEQPPDPGNRIVLTPNDDAPHTPVAHLDWRIGPREQAAARQFAHALQSEFARLGLPPIDWLPGALDGPPPAMSDTYHAMGGLRMGTDPATSVVDTNLKFHGLTNLYVASCATFPSGGSSNPTFTLIALALRLAEHLTAPLGSPPTPSATISAPPR